MRLRYKRNPEYRVRAEFGPLADWHVVEVRWEQRWRWGRWQYVDWRPVYQQSGPMAMVQYPLVFASRFDAEKAVERLRVRAESSDGEGR